MWRRGTAGWQETSGTVVGLFHLCLQATTALRYPGPQASISAYRPHRPGRRRASHGMDASKEPYEVIAFTEDGKHEVFAVR